jgi:hypothetical protein
VLDYERAGGAIETATVMGVGLCHRRRKMTHPGRACNAPLGIRMTFNTTASSLIRHGHARAVGAAEGLDPIQVADENLAVRFGENVREQLNFICNGCGRTEWWSWRSSAGSCRT